MKTGLRVGIRLTSLQTLCVAGSALLLPALPAAAQNSETAPGTSGLAMLITRTPMLIFLAIMAIFYGYMRRAVSRAKRYEEHMDRVEQLLERIATAVEHQPGPK